MIAEVLGLSISHVQQLTMQGILPSSKDSKKRLYDLVATVQAYVKYLREKKDGRFINEELQKRRLEADIALKEKRGQYLDTQNSDMALRRQMLEADLFYRETRSRYLEGRLSRDFPRMSREGARAMAEVERMKGELSHMSVEELYALLEKLNEDDEDLEKEDEEEE